MADFRRKIYQRLLEWKATEGKSALLIEGARRIGKSTIVEIFARNEYENYILIDFNKASEHVKQAFELFRELLFKKLSINEGMFFENAVLQQLTAAGHKAFFYVHYNKEKHRNDIELEFVISNKSKVNHKVFPIEVKSADRYTLTSLKRFDEKFHDRIGCSYVVHPKNYRKEGNTIFLPAYMAGLI